MSSIDDILKKWYADKKSLEEIEDRISDYKAKILREMNKKDVDELEAGNFTIKRRRVTRSSVSKNSIPAEIWKKYAVSCHFDTFHLKRK